MLVFFDASRAIRSVTAGDAKDFRLHLIGMALADNTVRKMCGIAKQFFEDAVDRKQLERNPFRHREIPTSTGGNSAREFYVTREMADSIIEACPDAEWRLLFALSRYGGLRCPSEHLRLRWDDIDWQLGRMTVSSPKTEHHEGKSARVVPLFPQLLPHLECAFDLAPDCSQFVIHSKRTGAKKLPDSVGADYSARRIESLAETVPQPASELRDRPSRKIPAARRLRVDRQLSGDREEALSAGD